MIPPLVIQAVSHLRNRIVASLGSLLVLLRSPQATESCWESTQSPHTPPWAVFAVRSEGVGSLLVCNRLVVSQLRSAKVVGSLR
jgi:hypothetical protein